MRFTFEVPGKPVPQGSMRSLGPRRMVHTNYTDLLPWRAAIAATALFERPPDWDTLGPMRVQATFYLPRPRGHYRHAILKPDAPWWPTKRIGDLDKFCRALLDSLTDAGVWADDAQAVQLHAEKIYTDGPGHLLCQVQHLTERNTTE